MASDRVLLLCLSFLFAVSLTAQKKLTFAAGNGKTINIDSLNKAIDSMLEETGIPGLSFAVITNNKVVFYNTYGYKKIPERERVNKQTIFEAASLSKSFLVFVAFKLIDQGRLDLDRPLYLYRDPGPQLTGDPRYKKITARMVLSHSSGLENWQRYNNPDSLEIVSEPGTKFVYSGMGYNLLADVIETITGKSYADYVNDILIKPMDLKNSYVQFKDVLRDSVQSLWPSNFAFGHDPFGRSLNKWLHGESVPASGNSVTAEDYANLVVALLGGIHISAASRNIILQPVVRLNEKSDAGYYGTGFEIYYANGDTLIAHGGDNPGFKAQLFYSVNKKSGIVFLANGERGKLLTSHLAEICAGLDVKEIYKRHYPDQYPSGATRLFSIYQKLGAASMWQELTDMKTRDQLRESDLSALGWDLLTHDSKTAKQVMEENLSLFPLSATTYGFLGELYLKQRRYELAYPALVMARELDFSWWDVEGKIRNCLGKMKDAEARRSNVLNIGPESSSVKANRYNSMDGVELGSVEDTGNKQLVAYLASGTWMDFKTQVQTAGRYMLSFRVSSRRGGNDLQVWKGDSLLSTIPVASTDSWSNWVTLKTEVMLGEGAQRLKIMASAQGGGFDINWMEFTRITP